MRICKDCLHSKACTLPAMPTMTSSDEMQCLNFTDRFEWVHLPCKVGDCIYEITEKRISGKWQKVIKERVVNCIEIGIGGMLGIRSGKTYVPLSMLHTTVFLTYKEAEKALEREDINEM